MPRKVDVHVNGFNHFTARERPCRGQGSGGTRGPRASSAPGTAAAAIHPAESERSQEAAEPPQSRGARLRRPRPGRRRHPDAALRIAQRREPAADHGGARTDPQRHPRRGLRPRSAGAAAAGPDHQRHSGERVQAGVRRAARRARACAGNLPGRQAPDARHRPDRERCRPPRRRQFADGRRAPRRWLARERGDPAARRRRSAALDPPFSQGPAQGRRPGRVPGAHAADARLSERSP